MREGWLIRKLDDVSTINMGQSPSSSSYNDSGDGSYLIQGNADIKNRLSVPRQWTSEPTKLCDIGDILMTVRAPVGAIAKSKHSACIGRGVCAIKAKDADSEFLYQYLLSYEDKWKSLEQGSTFTAVNGNDIKSVSIPLPPLPEQQKIAEILSTVDDKIDIISQQISETQELKKGLMQRLLTKGIGHTEFKDSPLGEIPKSWEVKIAEKVTDVEYGISEAVSQNKDSSIGIPIITGANIKLSGGLNFDKKSYIKKKENNPRFELEKGDILFNWRSGSPSHVGKTAVFGLSGDYTYASFILRLRTFPEKLNNIFFNYQIEFLKSKGYFTKETSIQVNFKINATVFRKIQFVIPPLKEQQKIANILSSVDDKLEVLSEKKAHCQELKKGLMQQLLTGKIRVTL